MPLPTRPAASLLPPPTSLGGAERGGTPSSLPSLQPRRTRAGWQDIPHSVRKEGFAERGRPPGAGNAVTLP